MQWSHDLVHAAVEESIIDASDGTLQPAPASPYDQAVSDALEDARRDEYLRQQALHSLTDPELGVTTAEVQPYEAVVDRDGVDTPTD